jgi:hypothetical protein
MLVRKKFTKYQELLDLLRGTSLASGTVGTNPAASPNFQDLTTDAFDAVSVGDRIHISGESTLTTFLVLTKTDVNNLVLDNNIVGIHSTNAVWRAFSSDGLDPADIVLGPIPDPLQAGAALIIYEIQDFGV